MRSNNHKNALILLISAIKCCILLSMLRIHRLEPSHLDPVTCILAVKIIKLLACQKELKTFETQLCSLQEQIFIHHVHQQWAKCGLLAAAALWTIFCSLIAAFSIRTFASRVCNTFVNFSQRLINVLLAHTVTLSNR